jgi:hypothetical protein
VNAGEVSTLIAWKSAEVGIPVGGVVFAEVAG